MDTIDRINMLLSERGMTGAELSRAIGVSTGTYSQWNKRLTKPSNKNLKKIADVLGVTVTDLTASGLSFASNPMSNISAEALADLVVQKLISAEKNPAELIDRISDEQYKVIQMVLNAPPEKLEEVSQILKSSE